MAFSTERVNRVIDRKRALLAGLVAVLVAAMLGFYTGQSGIVKSWLRVDVGGAVTSGSWSQLDTVRQYIDKYYYGATAVTPKQMTDGATKGLVEATGDRYSQFFTASEYKSFNTSLSDHFTGIGVRVEISPKTGRITVVSPLKDSPGEKAGLQAGDELLAVDGKDVSGMGLEQTVTLIRGPEGSKVTLTLVRPPNTTPFQVAVSRSRIPTPEMDARMLAGTPGVGYIQVYEFNTGVGQRVRNAIADLKAKGMDRGLVLDMRSNPGGLLPEAVDMASCFLPTDGTVLSITSKDGRKDVYKAKAWPKLDLPLMVLVDGNTASAAEIVSGAIQDARVGKLVGTKTFGKGVVQTTFGMTDGSGLKLTTAHWFTPNGTWINGKGITPDVLVPLPPGKPLKASDLGTDKDPQMQAALQTLLAK